MLPLDHPDRIQIAFDVTVQTWWVELAEGGLPNAGTGGGGYVIYRAWILKLTSPPSTAMC